MTGISSPSLKRLCLSADETWTWPVVIFGSLVLLAADFGFVSSFDASMLAIVIGLTFPRFLLGLTMIVISMQNALGASGISWYLGFVLLASIAFIQHLSVLRTHPRLFTRIPAIVLFAFFVIVYGTIISAIYSFLDYLPQDSDRPFWMVGMLMMLNVWFAHYFNVMISAGKIRFRDYAPFAWMALIHFLLVLVGQIWFGPGFLVNADENSDLVDFSQLVVSSALGIPRMTAQFSSPNTMALFFILAFLVLFQGRRHWKLSRGWLVFWVLCGIVITVTSQSKAIALFFAVTFLFLSVHKLGWVISILVGFGLLFVVDSFVTASLFDMLTDAFRISNELSGSSLRSRTWSAVISNFNSMDWVFGTGLSHWPIFIEQHLGIRLTDPHTVILSIPGTFGVFGVLFYFFLIIKLVKTAMRAHGGRQFASVVLLGVFLVRDMFGIPYIFGNTPVTFLIWFVLLRTLYPRLPDQPAPDVPAANNRQNIQCT